MSEKIGIVIPTCSPERKPFLDFVLARMQKQTRKPDFIALMNDPKIGKTPDLAKRYKEGIEKCVLNGCDFILFIEDDDYYPLDYIETMYTLWKQNNRPDIIGCNQTIYYHLFEKGWNILHTTRHASAHGTAVSANVKYKTCKDTNIYFDMDLWKENETHSKLVFFEGHCISMKHGIGLCGGAGHTSTRYSHKDIDFEKLKTFVDEEAFKFYMRIISEYEKKLKIEKENNPLNSEYYNRIYSEMSGEYAKVHPEKSIYFEVWKGIRNLISANATVLELGCGVGLFAKYLMESGVNYQRGVDYSTVAIDRAKAINPTHQNKFHIMDLRHVNRIPNHFTVICLEVLEHLENDLELLEKIDINTEVIFTVPDFDCESHQRHFKTEDEVFQRYTKLFSFVLIHKVKITSGNGVYIVKGVRI